MSLDDLITIDPFLEGHLYSKVRACPCELLLEYLENDYSLEEFLECFPSLSREMVRKVLERSDQALLSPA